MSAFPLPRNFDEEVFKEIDRKSAQLQDKVMAGGCTFDQYRFYAGQWVAMQAMRVFIKELVTDIDNAVE